MSKKIIFILIFFVVLLLFYPVLTTYFSQDDFFHFKVSQTDETIGGFMNLFGVHSFTERGIAFYRPISREVPFNLDYLLFGLNPLPFRIFLFIIHFINIVLVYYLTGKLFENKKLILFVTFFFAVTSSHVASFYYLAGGIQTLLATTFTLSSVLTFIKYLDGKKRQFILFSFILFLLGICSHEQATIIPILLLCLILIYQPKQFKSLSLKLIPYFLAVGILIYLEIFKIGFSANEQQYRAVFNLKTTLNSLFWYSNWALGIPETLIDFVRPGFKLNPALLRYWSNYYLFIFPSYFISISLIFLAAIYLMIKKISVFRNKNFLLCLIWFPLGLLPVILLPLHKSTHYLEISLPAFWAVIGFIVITFYQQFRIKRKLLAKVYLAILLGSLVILSTSSAILGSTNYWAASRGKIAEKLIQEVKNTYPILPKGAVVYFKNDPNYPILTEQWGHSSKQASLILNGNDAIQLLYHDSTIKVLYEDQQPQPKTSVFIITAKIY